MAVTNICTNRVYRHFGLHLLKNNNNFSVLILYFQLNYLFASDKMFINYHSSMLFYPILLLLLLLVCIIKLTINERIPHITVIDNDKKREERATKAQEILKFMNTTINPCRDFYGFACGNWLKYQQTFLAQTNQLISAHDQMNLKIKQQLQYMLEEPMTSFDSRSTRNMKDFYRACKTAESSSPLQRTFLREFIRKNGGLPFISGTSWQDSYNWLQIIARLRHFYSLNILISLDIIKDPTKHNYIAYNILLSEPKTTILPAELCSYIAIRQQYDKHQQQYELMEREVKENLMAWFEIRESEALRLAGDIVRFEFELCKHMKKDDMIKGHHYKSSEHEREREREHEHEHVTEPLGYMKYNSINGMPQFPIRTPYNLLQLSRDYQLNLKEYVDICLGNNIQTQVYLHSPTYFQHLAKLPRIWSMHSFANYIMYAALATINFPQQDNVKKRSIHCVDKLINYLPNIIGELYNYNYNYNTKYIDNETKHDIEMMSKLIKKSLQKTIELSTLKQNIKPYILGRLHPIQFTLITQQNYDIKPVDIMNRDIQYLDYWHKLESIMMFRANQSLTTSDNNLESYEVNVKFEPNSNQIQIGFGILQPPFYSQYYPYAMKYALLGQRIIKELIRAIDIKNNFEQHFYNNERFDCFRSQYSNYLYNMPNNFHNGSKLIDIITDSGALNIAFDLYLNWLQTIDSRDFDTLSEETLSDVNFSNTQLFFIHYAQTHCSAKFGTMKMKTKFPHMDHHTMERYDVNGPLSNNVEFGREFNCKLGMEMNPDDKCFVY